MSSLYSPSTAAVTENSRESASLESDVTLLMEALRINNRDEWEGKPQQEAFRLYEVVPPVGKSQPASCSAAIAAVARGLPPHQTDESTASSDSLNALMTDYVHAVRSLHAFDAQIAATGISESATGERGDAADGVVSLEEATAPSKAAADDGSASTTDAKLAEAAAPIDMAELLAALDRLPSITVDKEGQRR
ncbi:hypothetical protein JIQ42_08216 [Leishmania sp. Namibia]|uniref:hypothetical protein n=1 Tax=Leishmania sp. Namibia TaxID=2802991 RepID=UPI001B48EDC5|nr:hypothetical protein JIQ42_08216 [Leishmania sp. Namibia]